MIVWTTLTLLLLCRGAPVVADSTTTTSASSTSRTSTSIPSSTSIPPSNSTLQNVSSTTVSPNVTIAPYNASDSDNGTDVTNDTLYNTTQSPQYDDYEGSGEGEETDLSDLTDASMMEHCTCDLTVDSCDAGCCCDVDCTKDMKKLFSSCRYFRRSITADSRYCYHHWTVMADNTPYTVQQSQDGLMCIITDNNQKRTVYANKKIARTLQDYDRLRSFLPASRVRAYSPTATPHSLLSPYTQDSPVLAIDRTGTLFRLGLPSSMLGTSCDSLRRLSYLVDMSSTCVVRVTDRQCLKLSHPQLSVTHYLNILVVAQPSQLFKVQDTAPSKDEDAPTTPIPEGTDAPAPSEPTTKATNTTAEPSDVGQGTSNSVRESLVLPVANFQDKPDHLIQVQTTLCKHFNNTNYYSCEEWQENYLHEIHCDEIVRSVHYDVTLNATSGITNVFLKLTLDKTDENYIEQRFSVMYHWSEGEEVPERVVRRSGSPGYIRGAPLITGRLESNETEEGDSLEFISLDEEDQSIALSILTSGVGLECSSERSPVLFGENIHSSCLLHVTEDQILNHCDELRDEVLTALLGPLASEDESLRVSSYGDSALESPWDWVPLFRGPSPVPDYDDYYDILSSEGSRCSDLIVSAHLEVSYARQGSLSMPQNKVVGALLTTGPPVMSPVVHCSSQHCSSADQEEINYSGDYPDSSQAKVPLELAWTVVFTDVSQPAEPIYPKPPMIEFKLPFDFFYPYLPSGSQSFAEVNWRMVTMCLILILYFGFRL